MWLCKQWKFSRRNGKCVWRVAVTLNKPTYSLSLSFLRARFQREKPAPRTQSNSRMRKVRSRWNFAAGKLRSFTVSRTWLTMDPVNFAPRCCLELHFLREPYREPDSSSEILRCVHTCTRLISLCEWPR